MKKVKRIKILILIFLYILILTSVIVIYKQNGFEKKDIENKWTLFRIEEVQNPDQVFWHKNNLLVVKNLKIYELNLEDRILKDFGVIDKDEVLGELDDNLVFMKFQNHTIYSPEENATDIEIFNMEREEIFSKSYHETIKPIKIKNNFLIAEDNYLNSPQRTYKINLENGEIELFEEQEDVEIRGEETTEIVKQEKVLFNIPKVNDITSFSLNGNLEKVALLDIEGNIWIYFRKPRL